jgi:hypothetical protein
MSKLATAINEVHKLDRQYRALRTVCDALAEIHNAQQTVIVETEASARAVEAREKATAEMIEAEDKLEAVKADTAKRQKDAELAVNAAVKRQREVLAETGKKADAIIAEAAEQAKTKKKKVEADVAALKTQELLYREERDKYKSEVKAIKAELAELHKRFQV